MAMLRVNDLHFSIGETAILNGVSLSVEPGEKLGIIGPNGSGKTTLFNCISGFNTPSQGSLHFKGVDITKLSPHKRASLGLGRVFQNFGVFREMTVMDNMITAMESRQSGIIFPWSRKHKENQESALSYLKEFGLADKAGEKAGSLSGGQMRLLEITRTIAFGAEVFLLDEPTAGVSPKMKSDVERLLRLLHDMNKTVLIIEHDINFIQKLCDRVLVLDMGRVVLDGQPEAVRNDVRLQEIYFGRTKTEATASV